MSRVLASVGLLLAVGTVGWAQGTAPLPVPAGAAWVGEAKITLVATGALYDVLRTLSKAAGREIRYNTGVAQPGGRDLSFSQVHLNANGTPLQQVLLGICKELGLVYELGEGPYGLIDLLPGDWAVDGRPSGVAGDYTVRITFISVGVNRQSTFHLGAPEPVTTRTNRFVYLKLMVNAQTAEAGRLLAGVSQTYTVTPDQGAPEKYGENNPAGSYAAFTPGWGNEAVRFTQLSPDFLPGATKQIRLEGRLALFSTVKATEVHVAPASAGQTVTQEDVSVTVQSWKPEAGHLVVRSTVSAPSLTHKPAPGGEWVTAAIVQKDGREVAGRTGYVGSSGKDRNLYCGFGGAGGAEGADPDPATIDYLRLIFYRAGDADKSVPFVLENIPLPALE
jgi:hypothetical protein